MNNKNIIIAGAIAIGLYLFSQTKKIQYTTAAQKIAQRTRSTATPTVRKRTAQKIAQKIAQKVAQKVAQKKVDISKLPVQQLRYMIAHLMAQKKTGKEVIALKAELARREAAWSATHKVAPKRIGQPTTQAARIAALRKAAAQKIGKIIGKKVAQKVAQKKVASWKAPYRFPNSRFRVITPSDLLKNLAKKDIARKKVVQQKKVQKTTPGTPSDRRKSRLKALYGSHWHDIWLKRQKRR